MSSEQDNSNVSESGRLLGQVKWFNNKAGYGFITVNDGEFAGKDIFIHYSAIRVTNSQYKYLVQGEYVEFNLVKSNTDAHEYQATDISGVKGGALMCETRRVNRTTRDAADTASAPRPDRAPRRYKSAAPQPAADSGEFVTVRRRRTTTRPKKDGKPVATEA
jgi:cold shock CspA family protein